MTLQRAPDFYAEPARETGAGAALRRRGARELILCTLAGLFLVCSLSIALTRAPWYDEGLLANPALSLARTGYPGVSALDDNGPPLPFPKRVDLKGIREHAYMEMPLHVVLLAGWFKLLGFGLVQARMFTVWCGLAALLCWYCVVARLSLDRVIALATVALLAIDYGYALRSSEVRMDALSAAFGFGGLAAYLWLRETNFSRAILLSHACVSASAFTHPNGGVLAFAGLIFLTLLYDRRQIRLRHIALAACPYLIGAACWGLYIAQDVDSFRKQFLLNAVQGGRVETFASPFSTLKQEIVERYLGILGGLGGSYQDVLVALGDPHGLRKIKLVIPLSYGAGLAGFFWLGSSVRRQKGYQALLCLPVIYFFVLAFTDGRRSQCYVVHIIPVFLAPLAATLVWLWRKGGARRMAAAAWASLLCAVYLGGIAYQVKQDAYRESYLPAIRFLKEHTRADQMIIGPGVLGLGLEYPPNFVDDFRLGFLSHAIPEWIVVNEWYREWFRGLKNIEPDAYRFVTDRLDNQFVPVYNNADFTIYRKR